MFDCPEATHTSPTRMSRSTTRRAPETTVRSNGPPAPAGGRLTRHAPDRDARPWAVLPRKVTEMFADGRAHPQTTTGLSRWTTIPFEKNRGSESESICRDGFELACAPTVCARHAVSGMVAARIANRRGVIRRGSSRRERETRSHIDKMTCQKSMVCARRRPVKSSWRS